MIIAPVTPPLPVIVTSKDNRPGYAILVTDRGMEHHKIWTVIFDNGEMWDVPNPEIRVQWNWTMGRRQKEGA